MRFFLNIFTLLLTLSGAAAHAAISGQWLQHPTFDNSVLRTIDTGKRVYFMGYNQNYQNFITVKSSTQKTLFYYDIEGDELIAASRGANLSGTSVERIEYNAGRGYLFILYSDYDIDLLFDSGEVANIPALKHAAMPGSKRVNGVSFDSPRNNIWLATDFGYVLINDEKMEVEDSRNYGKAFLQAARVGETVFLTDAQTTVMAPASEKRLNLSDYTAISPRFGDKGIYPLSDKRMVTNSDGGQNTNIVRLMETDGRVVTTIQENSLWGDLVINPSAQGYIAAYGSATLQYTPSSDKFIYVGRPETDKGIVAGMATWDQKEYFTVHPRKGIRSFDGNGTITRDFMLPNAPNAFWSRGMAYNPKYGMLVNSHGIDPVFTGTGVNSISEPILLSALNNGNWTPLSPAYRNPEYTQAGYDPLGLLIDPADPKYVWSGSNFSGIIRLNLEDPKDVLHYSFPGDPTASLPGYVETNGIQSAWGKLCHFSPPRLDNQNTMWCHFHNMEIGEILEFRYLPDADRKASTSAATARPWKKLHVSGVKSSFNSVFLPLTSSFNKNLLLFMSQDYILVYDTNGSIENTSDDRKVIITPKFYDQDGGEVDLFRVNCAYEDPATGFVWFGTEKGVFYLQPSAILKGQRNVSRIKVGRHDGTNYADYLLNGVMVNDIMADQQGRKWFATRGAGIVVTSSDGRTLQGEFTTANSDIPSDNVYKLCLNPADRSIMVSTDNGLAQLFIGSAPGAGEGEQKVKAYPNPVAPDYYGWITIEGVEDNSLVKIVDASGNVVKELGRAEGGSIQWDANNLHNRRVKTGVYYILSSPGSGSGENNVAKILIMN